MGGGTEDDVPCYPVPLAHVRGSIGDALALGHQVDVGNELTPRPIAGAAAGVSSTMRELEEIGFSYRGVLRERPPPSPAQFAITESRVGAPLPFDYKAFLQRQNGGIPGLNFVRLADDAFVIECFNYLDGAKEDSYDVEAASEWPSEDLGEQVVAIACDGSGDQLLLRRADDAWRVDWWRHDEDEYLRVATSFSQLLELLEPFDELW